MGINDEDEVSFEVGRRDDGSLWTVSVSSKSKLTEQDFAASLISLAKDIISGVTSFETAPIVVDHDSH